MNDKHSSSEWILTGGTILTMDEANPVAPALLWRDNRIVATGPLGDVTKSCQASPYLIDLEGRTAVPGFNDSHIHLAQLGQHENGLILDGMSKAEILEALREYAAHRPAEKIITGFGWDYPNCPDPHRRDLDAIVPDTPVILMQFSGHGTWLNTAALDFLKIHRDTPDWDIGGAERDADGELTGVVREFGRAPGVRRLFRRYTGNRKAAAAGLPRAFEKLRENGITSVQDNTWFPWVMSEIAATGRSDRRTCRVSCWSAGFIPLLDFWLGMKRFDPDWFARGPRKYLADGAFSSHSAWLTEPYADRPETAGRGTDADEIAHWIRRAIRNGRQLAIHAIGDAATAAYLDAMERFDPSGLVPMRHRIEHCQLVREADFERIQRLGMVVSAQPHAAGNPPKDIGLLGAERARRAYPFRSLLDAGVPLAFGSDYPGETTYGPLYGVHLAVNREGGEAITPAEALFAYTAGGAWAEFRERDKGTLKAGYLCDIAILSADPTRVEPTSIKDISVDATIIDGRIVYERTGRELRLNPAAAVRSGKGTL